MSVASKSSTNMPSGPEDPSWKKPTEGELGEFRNEIPDGLSIEDGRQLAKPESPLRTRVMADAPKTESLEAIYKNDLVTKKESYEQAIAILEGKLAELSQLREAFQQDGDTIEGLSPEEKELARRLQVFKLDEVFRRRRSLLAEIDTTKGLLKRIVEDQDVELAKEEVVRQKRPPLSSFLPKTGDDPFSGQLEALFTRCADIQKALVNLRTQRDAIIEGQRKASKALFNREGKMNALKVRLDTKNDEIAGIEKIYEETAQELRAKGVPQPSLSGEKPPQTDHKGPASRND